MHCIAVTEETSKVSEVKAKKHRKAGLGVAVAYVFVNVF